MKNKYYLIIGLLAVVLLAVIFLLLPLQPAQKNGPSRNPVACTMEAKICPDGSAVGRSGPDCAFLPCPAVQIPADWKTSADDKQKISWRYPELNYAYVQTVDWPPVLSVGTGDFSCETASSTGPSVTSLKIINNQPYCQSLENEGAAGSTYSSYTYSVARGAQLLTLRFTIRFPQCLNYDEPKASACLAEEKNFDPDKLAGQIMSSLEFK